MKLAEFQSEFLAGIAKGKTDLVNVSAKKIHLRPTNRLIVYRNLVDASLIKALSLTYRRSCTILGQANFSKIAAEYVATFPSDTPNLNFYGEDFARFLTSQLKRLALGENLGFLPDLARVEWAINLARLASDPKKFDFESFAGIPANDHARIVFSLCPSVTFFRSLYPVHKLIEASDEALLKWTVHALRRESKPFYLMVHRSGFEANVSEIDFFSYRVLQKIKGGCMLGTLGRQFEQKSKALSELVQRLVAQECIASFTVSALQSQSA